MGLSLAEYRRGLFLGTGLRRLISPVLRHLHAVFGVRVS
jgi:hypothetical protein